MPKIVFKMNSQKQTSSVKMLSFAKSRLPVANKPKTRFSAPIPFAPRVDTYAFQPPPFYADVVLRVPHNTPEAPRVAHGPIGLGLEGVELGRLSGGFRETTDGLREEVHRMLSAQRRRAQTNERPMKRHDVFYGSPVRRGWERDTISTELKRAASLSRRASMSGSTYSSWRV